MSQSYPDQAMDEVLRIIIDLLKLDIKAVGCWLSGLVVRRSREIEGSDLGSRARIMDSYC